jgi:antitoxin component HigA of HigAB toxin-antitoxin module
VASLEQIHARLDKLQAQADDIRKQTSAVLEKIRGLMAEHGLTTADIDTHVGSKKRGPKVGSKVTLKSAQFTFVGGTTHRALVKPRHV